MEGTSTDESITFDEFVWAKVDGYPYWPAVVVKPGLHTPKRPDRLADVPARLVYFCATYDYAWVKESRIKPYLEEDHKLELTHVSKKFRKAVEEMDAHISKKAFDADYAVPLKTIYNPKTKQIEHIPTPSTSKAVVETKHVANKGVPLVSFGVIGIGVMGSTIAKILLDEGFTVNIWNRTKYKKIYQDVLFSIDESEQHLLSYNQTPRKVLQKSDIVFLCVLELTGIVHIMEEEFGLNNPTDEILQNKGVILVRARDLEISKTLNWKILEKGGQFLEVIITKVTSEDGIEEMQLTATGDNHLYDKCQATCFPALGTSTYKNEFGYDRRAAILLNLMKIVGLTGLLHALALIKFLRVSHQDLMTVMPNFEDFIITESDDE